MRILVAEDQPELRRMLVKNLTAAGYTVDGVPDGEEALVYLDAADYDVAVLDIMMPKVDGLTVLRTLRGRDEQLPVLLLTARDAVSDRVDGLDAGADDYIVKPFAFEELTARIRSLGRRSGKWEDDNLLTICDISYDCNARLLSGPTGSIRLSGREGRLLEVLLRSFELVIRREVLLSRVWGVDAEVEDCNLDTYIHYLRKRLSYVGSTLALKTIRGVGYTLASS